MGNLPQSHVFYHKYHTEGSEIEPESPLVTAGHRPNRRSRTTYLLVYTNMQSSATYTNTLVIYMYVINLFVISEETVL